MVERKKYPISVLIVDDEPVIVEQLSQILRRRVERLSCASDGSQAFEIFQTESVDLIISDIDMPVMNGIELLKAVRQENRNLPFILSTGLKSLDILIEAIEHGITSFLPKPLRISDLIAKIDTVARTKELEREIRKSQVLTEQYRSIVDASSIVSKTDPAGIITYVNDMFCAISGYEREELIGQPHSIVRDPKMPSNIFRHLWETIQSKKIWHGIIQNRTKEGGQYTVKSTIAPVLDEEGEIVEYIGLREDITDLMLKDESLRSERKKLDDILNHIDSIVAMVSVREKLLFVNHKFFDFFPYRDYYDYKSQHECICEIFEPGEGYLQQKMGDEYWVGYVMARPDEAHHALITDAEGHPRIFSVQVNSLMTKGEELFVVTLNDVTELQRAKEEAKTAARMKGDFLANMSHEIRTPMNGILGFTALLERTELSEHQKRYLEIINGSTHTLLGIINDILDFSKLESGKFELDYTPVNPFVEFDKMARLFSARMDEKKIAFDEIVDPRISECIRIDLLRIQQIVSNLLSNAVKFTPEGGKITFYAQLKETFENAITVRIGVKDTGIGISESHRQKIFEAFSQADSSTTRQFGGTGLGLSISSHLVSLMGGRLEVESAEGEGSDFYFELNVACCPVEHSLASYFKRRGIILIEGNDAVSAHLQQNVVTYLNQLNVAYKMYPNIDTLSSVGEEDVCIVFCDAHDEWIDFFIARGVMTLMVCDHPHVCYSAPNLHVIENLEHNYSALYNALLMMARESAISGGRKENGEIEKHFYGRVLVAEDNAVNQLLIEECLTQYGLETEIVDNGRDALERIGSKAFDLIFMDINMPVMSGIEAMRKIKEEGVDVPVIALTANAMAGDQEKFLGYGFDNYLSKPIVMVQLETILTLYLQKGDDLKVSVSVEPIAAPKTAAILDMDLIRRELPVSDAVILRLLKAFWQSADTSLSELRLSIESRDFQKIANAAHYLKGGAGNLRIKPIEAHASAIENAAILHDAGFDYDDTLGQIEQTMRSLIEEIRFVLASEE